MSIGDEFEYDHIHALWLLCEAEKINVPFDILQERLQVSIETMRSALLALSLTVELSKRNKLLSPVTKTRFSSLRSMAGTVPANAVMNPKFSAFFDDKENPLKRTRLSLLSGVFLT